MDYPVLLKSLRATFGSKHPPLKWCASWSGICNEDFGAAPLIAVTFPSRMAGFQSARISSVREFIEFRMFVSIMHVDIARRADAGVPQGPPLGAHRAQHVALCRDRANQPDSCSDPKCYAAKIAVYRNLLLSIHVAACWNGRRLERPNSGLSGKSIEVWTP